MVSTSNEKKEKGQRLPEGSWAGEIPIHFQPSSRLAYIFKTHAVVGYTKITAVSFFFTLKKIFLYPNF